MFEATVRSSSAFLLLAVALLGCAQAPVQLASPPAIEAVVPAIASHFSACSLDMLMTAYAPSIEFVSPSTPKPIVGLQAVREHFAGACTLSFRPAMKVEAQRVRMLSSESAVVTGTYTFGRSDRPNDKPWPAFFVITVQGVEGRWLVTTQASIPVPQ